MMYGHGMFNGVGEQKYICCRLWLFYVVTLINMAVILALVGFGQSCKSEA